MSTPRLSTSSLLSEKSQQGESCPNPSSTTCCEDSRATSFQLNGSFVRPMLLHQGGAEDETTDIHR
jgi:hypothetical protein